jgi:hypothetical protein
MLREVRGGLEEPAQTPVRDLEQEVETAVFS